MSNLPLLLESRSHWPLYECGYWMLQRRRRAWRWLRKGLTLAKVLCRQGYHYWSKNESRNQSLMARSWGFYQIHSEIKGRFEGWRIVLYFLYLHILGAGKVARSGRCTETVKYRFQRLYENVWITKKGKVLAWGDALLNSVLGYVPTAIGRNVP